MSRLHSHKPSAAKAYNIVADGVHHKLSDNFTLHEMQSKDGSLALLVHPALIDGLERLRQHFRRPVRINSGYRTHAHNEDIGGEDIGGARQSRHLWGMAADIVVEGVSASQVATKADAMGFGGVGQYDSFTHVDVQGKDRRWRG